MTRPRWPWLVFGLAAVVASVLVLYLGRDLLFFLDEWDWILRRRDPSVDNLLRPHVEHLSIIPVAIYEALLAVFGLTHYEAFRVLILAAHLGVCTLAFVYLSRRVVPVLALVGAIVLLFYGSGWQDILWPFQHAFLLSVASGIGAFLLLDTDSRRVDIGAAVLVGIALASSSVGIPVAVGIALELVLRREWRRLWVVAVPVAVYAIWYFAYATPKTRVDGPVELVRFVVESAGAVLGSLVGAGSTVGQVLLLVAVPAFVWSVVRASRERRPRLLGLAAIPVVFWVLLAASRAGLQPPDASRYLYPPAVFVVLVAAECVRTIRVRTAAVVAVAVAVAVVAVAAWSVVWNVGELREGRDVLLQASAFARIDLGAVRAGVDEVPEWYEAVRPPLREEMRLYAEAFDELGSPVATLATLAVGPEADRTRADSFLTRTVGLRLTAPREVDGSAPTILRGPASDVDASCIGLGRAPVDVDVQAGSRGLLIESRGDSPVAVSVRNLAAGDAGASGTRVGTVPAGEARTLLVPPVGGRPWKVTVISEGAVGVCAVGGR